MSDLPIIDSHIHLYPEAEIPTLNWCDADHPLASEQSITQYEAITAASRSLKGFILVETDRKSDLTEEGWKLPLTEVAWFARVATGKPNPGEDFGPETAEKCLALIPWAPVPAGPEALEKYIEKAKAVAGEEAWKKVKGFRYLLQDKPQGTMVADEFVEGVKYLGKKGYLFELGVDSHRRGKKQLADTLELISRAHEDVSDEEKTTFVISMSFLFSRRGEEMATITQDADPVSRRPHVQARSHHLQPGRPRLHQLAYRHVYHQLLRQDLHADQRRPPGDAGVAAEPLSGGHLRRHPPVARHPSRHLRTRAPHLWKRLANLHLGRRFQRVGEVARGCEEDVRHGVVGRG